MARGARHRLTAVALTGGARHRLTAVALTGGARRRLTATAMTRGTRLYLAAVAATAASLMAPVGAEAATAKVVRVVDGDTIQVRKGDRVRTVELLGLDAPELRGSSAETCGGAAAKRALKNLLPRRARVRLVADKASRGLGRYVYRGKRWVNRSMLRSGNARTDLAGALEPRLVAAEQAAQQEARGLWKRCAAPAGAPPGTPPPPAGGTTTTGPAAIQRARGDLSGRDFIRITTTTYSSSESRLNLCTDGSFVEDVTTESEVGPGTYGRYVGRWEVLDAIYTPEYGGARVVQHNADGSDGFLDFFVQNGVVYVNGKQVSVEPSTVCP